MFEGQFLKLGADPVTADGPGQGGVDFQGFSGDPLTFSRGLDVLQGPHVVQTVSQLDHQHPHILGNRQDELTQVLSLLGIFAIELQLGQLGDALHQLGDLGTEQMGDIVRRHRRVFDHIVQKRGDNGGGIQPIFGENACHLNGVGEIGIAGGALLRPVHTHGVNIGAIENRLVSGGIVGPDLINQLILTQHPWPLDGIGDRRVCWLGVRRILRRRNGERFCALGAQYRSSWPPSRSLCRARISSISLICM